MMKQREAKKFSFMLIALLALTITAGWLVYSYKTPEEKCTAFYDKHYAQIEPYTEPFFFSSNRKDMSDEEAQLAMAMIMQNTIAIADKANECGPFDDRFYEEQFRLCHGYLGNEGTQRFFNLLKMPFPYCQELLERGQTTTVAGHIIYYSKGEFVQRDLKKVISIIEDFVDRHPEHKDLMAFTIPIYRHGGHGVVKNEEKAFEILKAFNKEKTDSTMSCELSLYYRQGIGTRKNEELADKWLAHYNEKHPDKPCEFADWSNVLGPFPEENNTLKTQQ